MRDYKNILAIIFACIILAMSSAAASNEDDWINSAEKADILIKSRGSIDIIKEADSKIIDVELVSRQFPKNDSRQSVIKEITIPESVLSDSARIFSWKNPSSDVLEFMIESEVITKKRDFKITKKIGFPNKAKCLECSNFTRRTETINSESPNIIVKASEIIEGETDYFEAVAKLAIWVYDNIEYDLNLGSETKDSEWVLRNRKGTCDEKATLFAAMARSVGIPVKYISGIAYSNIEEIKGFGPHGWTEVYFPGEGWIPFDPTFGEFGNVDAGHVKFFETEDTADSSLSATWTGRNSEIMINNPETEAVLLSNYGNYDPGVEAEISFLKKSISFDSYNLLTIRISNKDNFYKAIDTRIALPKEIKIQDNENHRIVVLKPYEHKILNYLVSIRGSFDDDYVYTLPASLYIDGTQKSIAEFSASKESRYYSIEDLKHLIYEDSSTSTIADIDAGCSSEDVYEGEPAIIECILKNRGNRLFRNLKVCLGNDCKNTILGIGRERKLRFNYTAASAGEEDILFKIEGKNYKKIEPIKIDVRSLPRYEIKDIVHPKNARFKEDFDVEIKLKKAAISESRNIQIKFSGRGFEEIWSIKDPAENVNYKISVDGRILRDGENRFYVNITSYDKNGRYTTDNEMFSVYTHASLIEKIEMLFYDLVS